MFEYKEAFSRNIGLLTHDEQQTVRKVRVCIAGMGGVGGDYLVTLARCGIGNFNIADFDQFELANFNRQYGATISSIGHKKTDIMANLARDINPELDIQIFGGGVNKQNIDEFLVNCNVVINGIDLFAPDSHKLLINKACEQGLPVLSAVPVGFGAGMVIFDHNSMSFDDYFDFSEGMSNEDKVLQLALGFAPAGYQLKYMDTSSVDLKAHRGPSSAAGCKLCAGLIATNTIKAILQPEKLHSAPWYTHIDANLGRMRHKKLWMGNRNPLQKLKKILAKKKLNL